MARSTLPLLALLALGTLATAAWLVLSGGDGSTAPPALDPSGPSSPVSRAGRSVDRGGSGGESMTPVGEPDRVPGASAGRTEVGRGSRADDSSRVPAGGVIRVAVVRAEDEKPMPGARVTFLDRKSQRGWREAWKDPRKRGPFLATRGTTLVADAAGLLIVPYTTSGALSAQFRGLYGELEWSDAPRETLRLAMTAPVALKVQLVDGGGRPLADAMVVLAVESGGVRKTLLTRKASGPQALAVFPRLRQVYGSLGPDERLRIEPGFPCSGDPKLSIDPHAVPTEVQRLMVGSIGSLRVRVTDERGRALEEVATVTLGRFVPGTDGPTFEGLHAVRLMGGRATFSHLGLGLTVAVRLDGAVERAPQIFEVPGPTRPGQETEARLDWTALYPVLVARAVNESGEVLSNRGGTFLVHQKGEALGGSPVRTDTRGELRIVIEEPREGGGARKLEVRLRGAGSQPPMEARRDLDRTLAGGEHDLGDLLFRTPPLLVSGVVRDANGGPLSGVRVRVQFPGGPQSGAANLVTRTDRRGVFNVYGTCAASAVTVVLAHGGFETLRQHNVRPGTSGLELQLHEGGGG